ncbi:sodium:proton antiporter [Ahrensia sp. R2A130]|uniref:cation:proton antiporter n=1 Tax=Ahrensia sp. R2A130 TaxID=744979 RepID=UPI0001E0B48D|nr:sodium:proton antiporter [Ahrensia sp. R2A130]EFL90731.1 sodium/hydrogen exchanger [Ahrensia sp. R2A130]
MTLSLFEIAALLLALSGFFGWFNHTVLKLPHTIGLLVMALISSVALLGLESVVPSLGITSTLQGAIGQIDFYATVMEGMLAFLLFAGALHVDFSFLRSQAWAIGLMATVGVVLSTFIVGVGFWYLSSLFGFEVPLIWCLVFGALISPTDPVAVLSLLKSINVPEALEAKIAGESLFNDGVGVVLFAILLTIATSTGSTEVTVLQVGELFVVEALGGAVLGAVTGWIAYKAMSTIDEHMLEILLTLGIVAATYAIALRLHLSGPIAVVVAGLLVGNRGADMAKSDHTRVSMFSFWELIDEILNSVLFLLIGLEVLIISLDPGFAWVAAATIPLVLAARFIAVSTPIMFLSIRQNFEAGAIPVLTWGGLRGGVSVALALSLPAVTHKPLLLACTYAVVLFSIIVQGLTVKAVVNRTVDPTLI